MYNSETTNRRKIRMKRTCLNCAALNGRNCDLGHPVKTHGLAYVRPLEHVLNQKHIKSLYCIDINNKKY